MTPHRDVPSPVLLLGGRSEIGLEVVAALLEQRSRPVVLASRQGGSAHRGDGGARLHGAGATAVRTIAFDADDLSSHAGVLEEALRGVDRPVVVLAFGLLGDQARARVDAAHAVQILTTDFLAQVSVLTHLRRLLEASGGTVIVFSSIAGVRVRRANYVYGSAKAGLDGFVSGLQDSLATSPLDVVLVRPGFVVGRMTAGMRPAPLSSTPRDVGRAVARAVVSGQRVVWVPSHLRWLGAAFLVTPRALWRRLSR